jgi:hypothetical protein
MKVECLRIWGVLAVLQLALPLNFLLPAGFQTAVTC